MVMTPILEYTNVKKETDGFVHNCEKCPYITKSWFSITNHVERHRDTSKVLFDCSLSTPEIFLCKMCKFGTYETIIFRRHIEEHNLQTPSVFSPNSVNEICDKHELAAKIICASLFYCDKCSYATYRETSLKRHIYNKHTAASDIKWFQCDKCSYKTKVQGDLNRHNRSKHTARKEITWFYCDECSYKARRKTYLDAHIHLKHKYIVHYQVK